MSNLKVGMRVIAVTDYPENNFKRISVGDFGTVTGFDEYVKDFVRVHFDNGRREEFYDWRVEPVTDEPKQMKATDKITVEITLAELAKIYAVLGKCSGHKCSDLYSLAQKTFDVENKRLEFMNDIEGADVLKYHNYENDFLKLMFPQPPKKSKEQIKIEELQSTIDKAARELKELREMGENK